AISRRDTSPRAIFPSSARPSPASWHYTGVLTPRGAKTVDHYARIAAPAAPVLSQIAGGALGAATYFAKVTLVSPSGETTPSAEASLAVATNGLLQVGA